VFRLPHGDPRHGRAASRSDELVEIDRSPLTDKKRFTQRCDIGIIEGRLLQRGKRSRSADFRRNCDVLIALGQCAIMGGLPAMRNAIMHSDEPLRECLEEALSPAATSATPPTISPTIPRCRCCSTRSTPARTWSRSTTTFPAARRMGDVIYDTLISCSRPVPRLRA
jgi:NAD-reducing hydrogenase small subunit